MVAGAGTWFPEEKDGPGHDVFAFGEQGGAQGGALQIPGPLLRVPVGTELHITLRNATDSTLTIYGLHDRPGVGAAIQLSPGSTREVRFKVGAPGSYYYWGSTSKARLLRDRWGVETQLGGALIVDEPGARTDDHVFVLGIEDGPGPNPAERDLFGAVVNGRSWPHSHQYTVQQGDTVRVRWINLTSRSHPIHLHGFYFRVDRFGDIAQDTIYRSEQQRSAVTELMGPGQTMSIHWAPDRPGNWLMHCHMALHMSPTLRLGVKAANTAHKGNHSLEAMSGLVTGWRDSRAREAKRPTRRRGMDTVCDCWYSPEPMCTVQLRVSALSSRAEARRRARIQSRYPGRRCCSNADSPRASPW
jgi:hypothetical protein